jgi:TrmH family RNA methyltransferase
MQQYKQIVSKDNTLVKHMVRLANERKFRASNQQAVIYGEHLVREAHKFGVLNQIFILDSSLSKYAVFLESLTIPLIVVTLEVMQKMNVLESVVDLIALIDIRTPHEVNLAADCLVLENIQDPGNLGTILRAAKASAISQIIISKSSVDLYNPKVLRASQGLQLGLDVYCDIEIVEFLASYRGQILCLSPHAKASLYDKDLSPSTAFVFGNEGSGLSPELLNVFGTLVMIPMPGAAESLNLAMAATVTIFEMTRQRLYSSRL